MTTLDEEITRIKAGLDKVTDGFNEATAGIIAIERSGLGMGGSQALALIKPFLEQMHRTADELETLLTNATGVQS